MKPYMFVFTAVPTPDNASCEDIAGAKVHIWVIADNKEEAKLLAKQDIANYHWHITGVEHELEIQPEQIPHLHEAEALLYQKALRNGIAADYLAHPKQQGKPDDPWIVKKLEP